MTNSHPQYLPLDSRSISPLLIPLIAPHSPLPAVSSTHTATCCLLHTPRYLLSAPHFPPLAVSSTHTATCCLLHTPRYLLPAPHFPLLAVSSTHTATCCLLHRHRYLVSAPHSPLLAVCGLPWEATRTERFNQAAESVDGVEGWATAHRYPVVVG